MIVPFCKVTKWCMDPTGKIIPCPKSTASMWSHQALILALVSSDKRNCRGAGKNMLHRAVVQNAPFGFSCDAHLEPLHFPNVFNITQTYLNLPFQTYSTTHFTIQMGHSIYSLDSPLTHRFQPCTLLHSSCPPSLRRAKGRSCPRKNGDKMVVWWFWCFVVGFHTWFLLVLWKNPAVFLKIYDVVWLWNGGYDTLKHVMTLKIRRNKCQFLSLQISGHHRAPAFQQGLAQAA